MKKLSIYTFLVLIFCNVGFAKTYRANSASWSHSSDSAYSDCGFTGFICSMTMDAKANVNKTSIGNYLIIYDKNRKKIDEFKVKKIYYENGRCFITPQSKRKYTTYFVTYNCRAR